MKNAILTFLFLGLFSPLITQAQIALDDLTDALNDGSTIAIGNGAGLNDLGANQNVFIGNNAAALNSSGKYNIAIGKNALHDNTTGNQNVGIGYFTLNLNDTGKGNTALGFQCLHSNTTGQYNTAIGNSALYANSSGVSNTAIGLSALLNNKASLNTAVGANSLFNNITGENNAAFGNAALYNNTLGSYNLASGVRSLFHNTKGQYNTAVGYYAMQMNTTGMHCTGVGHSANSTADDFSNTTGLGYNADCTASNQVRIGNANVVSIGGYANWTNISDARFKSNATEDVKGLAFINALRPVTYQLNLHAIDDWWADNYGEIDSAMQHSNFEKEAIIQSGFIAQEVEMAAQKVGYNFSGVDLPKNDKDFYGLRYAEFVVPLVKAVQELSQQNHQFEAQIAELKAQNALLLEYVSLLKAETTQTY